MNKLTITLIALISFNSLNLSKQESEHDRNHSEETSVEFLDDSNYDPNEGWPKDTPQHLLDFNFYRLHSAKERYFRLGDWNPCNANMRFLAVPEDNRLGLCDCNLFQCARPLLYYNRTEECYWAWSQGPCKDGEYFTFGKGMLPVCEKDPCPEFPKTEGATSKFYFFNPDDKKCYHTDSQDLCKENEHLAIFPFEPIPKCRSFIKCYGLFVPRLQLCIQATRRHQDKFCTFE